MIQSRWKQGSVQLSALNSVMLQDVSVNINQTTKRTFTLAVIFQASIVSRETMISHGHVKPKNYICVFPSDKGKSTSWTVAKESSWRKV